MLGLHRALPILAFVTACGSGAAAIGDPLATPPDEAGDSGSTITDPSMADDGGLDANTAPDATKPKPVMDAGMPDTSDGAVADAGFCGYAVSFTKWTLTGTQCLFVKQGTVVYEVGGAPDCAHPTVAACGPICTASSVTFYTSDGHADGDPNFQRTPYDRAVSGSPGTCP